MTDSDWTSCERKSKVTLHTLRLTLATWFTEAGVDLWGGAASLEKQPKFVRTSRTVIPRNFREKTQPKNARFSACKLCEVFEGKEFRDR